MTTLTISVLIVACFAVQPSDAQRARLPGEISRTPIKAEHSATGDWYSGGDHDASKAVDLDTATFSYTVKGDDDDAIWLKFTLDNVYCIEKVVWFKYNNIIYNTIEVDTTWTCSTSDCSTCVGRKCNRYSLTVLNSETASGGSFVDCTYGNSVKIELIEIDEFDSNPSLRVSEIAIIVKQAISTPPETTNVAKGAEAKFTCKASGVNAATITFHKASNDESVVPVDVTVSDATSGGIVTTTGVLTISGVTAAEHGIEYYCKAKWGVDEVRSDNVYLSVLDITGSTTTVWGVIDKVVDFGCRSDCVLKKNADGDPYLPVGEDDCNVDATVSWEFFDETWKSTDTDRFKMRTTTTNDGLRVSKIIVLALKDDDDGLKLRCNIAYQTDPSKNFYGGTVTSGDLILKIAYITSFTPSNTDRPIVDETITLTCIASAETVPTFSFTTDAWSYFDDTYLEFVEDAHTSVGTTHTAKYTAKIVRANVERAGQDIWCEADFGEDLIHYKDKTSIIVTTYYNCNGMAEEQSCLKS